MNTRPLLPLHHNVRYGKSEPAPALALVLAAAPSLLPPPQARLLPPWYGAVDCYTSALSADDLALVRRYIALNKQAILDHWRELTDGSELVRALRRLS